MTLHAPTQRTNRIPGCQNRPNLRTYSTSDPFVVPTRLREIVELSSILDLSPAITDTVQKVIRELPLFAAPQPHGPAAIVFENKPKPGEQYHFLCRRWDVCRAWQTQGDPANSMANIAVAKWAEKCKMHRLDFAKMAAGEVDLSIPLLVATIQGDDEALYWPIDGWHRIALAHLYGVEKLPAVVLNVKQTERAEL